MTGHVLRCKASAWPHMLSNWIWSGCALHLTAVAYPIWRKLRSLNFANLISTPIRAWLGTLRDIATTGGDHMSSFCGGPIIQFSNARASQLPDIR